ncbi:MAG: phosphomannomutase/phosphoglucomutase [Gemmatimonadetes bacterium]|nr:phosphomannomutase/phosphoglucomutase [Gemmatimonadota bacterium]
MALNEHIFREYDIRGVVDRDLSGGVPTSIGRAFGSELRERGGGAGRLTVVVGHDNRPSSPGLAADVIEGLRSAGVDVVFIGTVPTPVLYWAAKRFGTDAGLQITGSHNPPEYNGFKMLTGDRSFYGEAIQRLKERIREGKWTEGSGSLEERSVLEEYIEDVVGRFELERPVKVVVDCGNGVASLVAVDLLEALGAHVIPLYCESDGTFPNHHPDPTVDEYIVDLIDRVRSEGAEVGIGFDGDADRIGAVDETGAIIRGDILLLLFALDVIARDGKGQKLIFDVKCSQALPEVLEAHGGEPIMWKTGHSLIKEKMKETGAPVAGELSGHICFSDDYYGFDDALYAACRLIDLVARSDRPLSDRTAEFPQYLSTPEIRVEVPEERKFEIVSRAVEEFSRDHEVIAVDGARVLFDGGWGLLRASNTQPVLVLRYEARTEAQLGAIRSAIEGWLRKQGVTP